MTKAEIDDMFDSIAALFFQWEKAADGLESRELRQKMERHTFVLAHDFFNLGISLMNYFDPEELFCGDSSTSQN